MSVEWHVGRPGFNWIYGPQGENIAVVDVVFRDAGEARSIAAQIVREHNAHEELVAALQYILDWKPSAAAWNAETARDKARAALAKAGAA